RIERRIARAVRVEALLIDEQRVDRRDDVGDLDVVEVERRGEVLEAADAVQHDVEGPRLRFLGLHVRIAPLDLDLEREERGARPLERVGLVAARHAERRVGIADQREAKLLDREAIRVVRAVAPRRERRVLTRVAGSERHDEEQRALEELRGIRRAVRDLIAAAQPQPVRRGPVEERLVRADLADREAVIRVSVAELELEPLRRRDEQLAVNLGDVGFAERVVRREETDRMIGDRYVVVQRIEAERVLPVGGSGRETQLAGRQLGKPALEVRLEDVLREPRRRSRLRVDRFEAARIEAALTEEDRQAGRTFETVVASERERALAEVRLRDEALIALQ